MASEISLTSSMRANLVSLQRTQGQIDQTQTRLSTGKRVNSALDNPTNYFVAANHTKRASDFTGRKDGMTEAIQAIKAADNGISGIKSLLQSASGLIESARSASATDRATLAAQYNEVLNQVDLLVEDAKYKGTNFLDSDTLDVAFNEDASNKLTITGFDASAAGLAVTDAANSWAALADLDTDAPLITAAMTTLATQSSTLSSNLSIVNARLDFTTGLVNNEKAGADNLTLADMNEESANMLALQTQQSLGITSLSLASQAAQSVLRLF